MKKLVSAMAFLLSFSTLASTLDVKPKRGLKLGDPYVRVTKLENEKVRIEKCLSGLEAKTCEKLGRRSSYSIKLLRSQRAEENREIVYSAVADVGLIAGAAYVGFYAGIVVVNALPAATSATITHFVVMPSVIGSLETGAALLIANANILNPLEQARQAKTLNEEVINDEDVEIDNDEMNDFIQRLDLVLSKI